MKFGRSLLLGILSGSVAAMSIVPWPAAPLIFVAAALFYAALTPRGEALGFFASLGVGLAAGATTSLIVMSWLPATMVRFGGLPLGAAWGLSAAAFLWHGAPLAVAAGISALFAKLGVRVERTLPFAVAVSFSLVVALFPWRWTIGALPMLPFVQVVELGGAGLVDFAITAVGCFSVVAFRLRAERGTPAFRWAAGLALAALLLPTLYGLVRIPMVEAARAEGRAITVGVVQPNVLFEDKSDEAKAPAILAKLQRMSAALEAQGAELILWPETAYPYDFPRAIRTDRGGERRVAEGFTAPLVFGARTAVGVCGRWNSVLALEGGSVVGVVDKVRRLPFAEFIPFWRSTPDQQGELACPGITRGDDRVRFVRAAGVKMGVFNCYEDVMASRGFRVARQGPELLINVTNDMWFGRSAEPYLHQAAARVRSLESRRDLIRATNTGVSGHIAATGALLAETPLFEAQGLLVEARVMHGATPFVYLGDWPLGVFGIGLLVLFYRRAKAAWQARRGRA